LYIIAKIVNLARQYGVYNLSTEFVQHIKFLQMAIKFLSQSLLKLSWIQFT